MVHVNESSPKKFDGAWAKVVEVYNQQCSKKGVRARIGPP